MAKSLLTLLQITAVFFVVTTPLYYGVSSLASRADLLVAFSLVLSSVILASYWNKPKIGMGVILLGSLLFLLWRSFVGDPSLESAVNFRQFVFASRDAQQGHLVFDESHSYFFAPSLILYVLWKIFDIPAAMTIYVSLFLYGVLAALIAVMIGRAICRTGSYPKNRNAQALLAGVVAISVVSFAYSERLRILDGGGLTGLFFLVTILTVLLFAEGLKSRSHVMVMLVLVMGVALGSTDGVMFLVPLFLLLSLTSKDKTVILYGLMPLSYFVFAGYVYVTRLGVYSGYALDGFSQFLSSTIQGEPWGRILPWQRTSILSKEDAFVASVGYLSLILLSIVIAAIATYVLVKERKTAMDNRHSQAYLRSNTACLWLWLVASSIAYIGASIKPEVVFSDIRTIAIVLMSWCLVPMFLSKAVVARMTSKRILLVLVLAMMIVACLRTPYQVYPKSSHDSVNALEDPRLSQASIYAAGRHVVIYYDVVSVVEDYKAEVRMGSMVPESRLLDDTAFSKPQVGSILVFSKAGINYPSPWHSRELYLAAFDLAKAHNRTYDNGAVVIAWIASG